MKPSIGSGSPTVVEWPEEVSQEDIDAHFREIRALASNADALAIVVDMSKSGVPPALLRKHAARRLAETYAVVGGRIVGVAHVITSPVVRGMMMAIYWLSPPPFPTVVVATRAEAIDWTRSRIRGASKLASFEHDSGTRQRAS